MKVKGRVDGKERLDSFCRDPAPIRRSHNVTCPEVNEHVSEGKVPRYQSGGNDPDR